MNRSIQLESEQQRMLGILQKEPSVRKVYLFGSMASNHTDEDSDMDLCIVQETELRFYDRLAYWIRRLNPQVGVDIIVYTPEEVSKLKANRRFFEQEIIAKGKSLYDAG